MRGIRWLISVTVACGVLPWAPARAGGGGGCSAPLTSATGGAVEMREFCFSPTVLRVRPGTKVTFVNRDRVGHNVIGANARWGEWEELGPEDSVTRTFRRRGVFPFACGFHPGMMGAVVVGRGAASATRSPVAAAGTVVDGEAAAADPPTDLASRSEAGWRPIAFLPWAIAAAGIGYGILERRRARRLPT